MNNIRTLSNGIRVVSEYIPYLKSVSIGVWVRNGSVNEKKEENGISHFIEHMLFKGTAKRSARDITLEMDSVGGRINAFTAAEYTCFYTKTLDAHAPLAIDILSDMLYDSRLDKKDMDLERNVIFEEIDMCADEPEEVVHDLIMRAAYGDTALGRTILGTKESLADIDSDMMRKYLQSHYTTENTVIAISGHFDDSIFELLEEYFGKRDISNDKVEALSADYRSGKIIKSKDCEQVQLVAGFRGIDITDERIYSLLVFNNIFGEGMSSRLFQNIRESEGLVYSIYAYHSMYRDTGMFNIAAGMNPKNFDRVTELIGKEIKRAQTEKLTEDEVARAKEQLKGNYILSYENTGSRMQSAGRSLLMDKPIYSPEEVLNKIDAVDCASVGEIVEEILRKDMLSIAVVGAISEDKEINIDCK